MAMLPIADIVSTSASPQATPRPKAGQAVAVDNTVPSASLMPIARQIDAGIEVIHPGVALQKNFTDIPLARVYHPRQAPSAISSENYLAARAAMNPGFVHNVAHTNSARISNLYKDVPRFRDHVDLIA
jgi:hypothetical protein